MPGRRAGRTGHGGHGSRDRHLSAPTLSNLEGTGHTWLFKTLQLNKTENIVFPGTSRKSVLGDHTWLPCSRSTRRTFRHTMLCPRSAGTTGAQAPSAPPPYGATPRPTPHHRTDARPVQLPHPGLRVPHSLPSKAPVRAETGVQGPGPGSAASAAASTRARECRAQGQPDGCGRASHSRRGLAKPGGPCRPSPDNDSLVPSLYHTAPGQPGLR